MSYTYIETITKLPLLLTKKSFVMVSFISFGNSAYKSKLKAQTVTQNAEMLNFQSAKLTGAVSEVAGVVVASGSSPRGSSISRTGVVCGELIESDSGSMDVGGVLLAISPARSGIIGASGVGSSVVS